MSAGAMVRAWQTRLRGGVVLDAATAGAALTAVTTLVLAVGAGHPRWSVPAGVVLGTLAAALVMLRGWTRWTPVAVAALVEERVPALENLVFTAVQLEAAPGGVSSRMRDEVARLAAERAAAVEPSRVLPLGVKVGQCAAVVAGAALVLWMTQARDLVVPSWPEPAGAIAAAGIEQVRAHVTAPDYRGLAPVVVDDADEVVVPEGGRVRLDVRSWRAVVWLEQPSGVSVLTADGAGGHTTEWTPTTTSSLVVAAGDDQESAGETRLLLIRVEPDEPPRVRVTAPGRDLAFATPAQVVPITIEAEDAEGLSALELRFVKLSGSGEAFTFSEGVIPIQVDRSAGTRWRGQARWNLTSVGLEDGDAVVYRAVVRDTHPERDWVSSESYTIDVGRRLEFASDGSAVPEEERRYAISQQMVIIKTEQLEAKRGELSAEEWAEQTRFLGMEQRMVRSEVIFLSGGEVQDEVEEAEHSHELQEGRLENSGRAEMLRAINDMSRAETLLTGGDTKEALVFERSALAALQRAFDRRRYFLRTTPERSRIDQTRRLTGDLERARPFERPVPQPAADRLADERALASELARAAGGAITPALVSRVAAVDPKAPEWRAVASALAAAGTDEERRSAVASAMALLAERARSRLAPGGGWSGHADALDGWWAGELRARRPQ